MGASNLDRVEASRRVGGQINVAKTQSLISDSMVNANATVTLLKAAITAAVVRPDDQPIAVWTNKALDLGVDIGVIPETHGVTTVAALVALTDASANFRMSLNA